MTAWLKCTLIVPALAGVGCDLPCTPIVYNVALSDRSECGAQHTMSTQTINGQLYVMCTCPRKDVEK